MCIFDDAVVFVADVSPQSQQQPDADLFADFLSSSVAGPSAVPSQTGAPAGSEMFGSAPAAATSLAKTSTKDAIMALYGNTPCISAPGPYSMPPAGILFIHLFQNFERWSRENKFKRQHSFVWI